MAVSLACYPAPWRPSRRWLEPFRGATVRWPCHSRRAWSATHAWVPIPTLSVCRISSIRLTHVLRKGRMGVHGARRRSTPKSVYPFGRRPLLLSSSRVSRRKIRKGAIIPLIGASVATRSSGGARLRLECPRRSSFMISCKPFCNVDNRPSTASRR